MFNEEIHMLIADIPGSKNISDDIFIYRNGDNMISMTKVHDRALVVVLKRLEGSELTVNDRNVYHVPIIDFFGLSFSQDGVSPDPTIQTIHQMAVPMNIKELRSFFGMISYCSCFIPNFAMITEPLCWLTKRDVEYKWSSEQDGAFQELKNRLVEDALNVYFEPTKTTEVVVDASLVGLGAMLCQSSHPVAFASRALSEVETRYSQIEREALAVIWACERFDMYLRGAPEFIVYTDHQALERFGKKPRPPLRIERWGLRLQLYKLHIQDKDHGTLQIICQDTRSLGPASKHQRTAENYVNCTASTSTPPMH